MKANVFFWMVGIWLLAMNGFAQNAIKGNGNLVTKEFSISDYNEISYVGEMDIEYEQSNASPSFKITVDENILPYFEIETKGKTLVIQPKEGKKQSNGNSYGLSLQPTVCKIKTNSRELKEISGVGNGKFVARSAIKTDKLEITIAGSSTVDFGMPLETRKVNLSVAGSGSIHLNKLNTSNLDCSVAGSGSILLKGTAERGNLSVAGGGEIDALECVLQKAECSVAGGGNIKVYASERLDASIAGGGNIRYKGDPELSKSVIGGGSVKKN